MPQTILTGALDVCSLGTTQKSKSKTKQTSWSVKYRTLGRWGFPLALAQAPQRLH